MTRRQTPLHKARREAAAELGCGPTDQRAIRLATLQVAYDYVQAQLAAGQVVDVGNVLKLDAALAEIRRAVAPAPQVKVEFAETLIGICKNCGHEHHDYKPPETPKPPVDTQRESNRTESHLNGSAGPSTTIIPAAESKPVEPEAPKPLWFERGYVPRQNFTDTCVKNGATRDSHFGSFRAGPDRFSPSYKPRSPGQ
jgi:hypothetical protein